jgi:non-heme chloroperoxidase
MPFIETRDRTKLYYRDWGEGPALVFVASQAVPSDIWTHLSARFAESGMRCVAFDRRGHGRSDQPSVGYDLDTLADDLRAVLAQLDLRDVTLVGHSLGGAEVVRYIGKYPGDRRVERAVLLAPTTPFMTRTDDNPDGVDPATFEALRDAWRRDLPRWVREGVPPFFAVPTSEPFMAWVERLFLDIPLHVLLQCSKSSMNSDLRADLRSIRIPTLVLHGDRDVSVPLSFGKATAALLPNGTLKVYEGAAHGLFLTHPDRIQRDITDFQRSTRHAA